MSNRLKLHDILKNVLGSNNVYFQPPESVKINYPCIIYKRTSADTSFANNQPYINKRRYQITVIDANPDSLIPEKIKLLPMCVYDRHYTSNNLNHDIFNIYF